MAKKIDFGAEFDKQRAAGVNVVDPMANLITKPDAGTPEPAADKLAGFTPAVQTAKRTKRVQIVMTPELYDRTKTAADNAGISFNEFINQLCNKVTQ